MPAKKNSFAEVHVIHVEKLRGMFGEETCCSSHVSHVRTSTATIKAHLQCTSVVASQDSTTFGRTTHAQFYRN